MTTYAQGPFGHHGCSYMPHKGKHICIFTMKRHSGKLVTTATLGEWDGVAFTYDWNAWKTTLIDSNTRATAANVRKQHEAALEAWKLREDLP